jgi:hypothetical protein
VQDALSREVKSARIRENANDSLIEAIAGTNREGYNFFAEFLLAVMMLLGCFVVLSAGFTANFF